MYKHILIGSGAFREDPRDVDVLTLRYMTPQRKLDSLFVTDADRLWLFAGKLDHHLTLSEISYPEYDLDELWVPSEALLAHIYRSHLTSKRKAFWKHFVTFSTQFKQAYLDSMEEKVLRQYSKAREKEYRERSQTRSWTLRGMVKDEFFGNNVKYYQEHDDVHKAIAFEPNTPAYTFMQEPGNEVECSRDLWNSMSERRKLNTVKEEMAVIAIERVIAPLHFEGRPEEIDIEKALRIACYKLCTTLSSGWFQRYVVLNAYQVFQELLSDIDWLLRWLKATQDGSITLLTQN